jgi:HPt (histidine-containing phosphotransfer) domain-containing protein
MAQSDVAEFPELLERLDQFGLFSDPAVLSDTLREFDTGLAEQNSAIDSALRASDPRGVERAAHRIAGSSLTLGVKRIGNRAAELERRAANVAAANNDLDHLRQLAAELAHEIELARAYIASILAAPPSATIRRAR